MRPVGPVASLNALIDLVFSISINVSPIPFKYPPLLNTCLYAEIALLAESLELGRAGRGLHYSQGSAGTNQSLAVEEVPGQDSLHLSVSVHQQQHQQAAQPDPALHRLLLKLWIR